MKRNRTIGLLALAITALLLTQCKKEDSNIPSAGKPTAQETTVNGSITTAKAWLAQQQAALVKSGGAMQLADAKKINWNNPISSTDGNTLFVPVATDNQQLGKYVKIYKDANGAITGGSYVFLYPTMDKLTDAYLLEGKKIPAEFSGTLLEYGLNNQLLASKVYEKGSAVAGKTTKLVFKPTIGKGNMATGGNAAAGGSAQAKVVCYEYYMQTYVNGLLVTEVYLYTMCYGTPDATLETEGGGGGVLDETAALMAQFNDHVKSTTPMPASITAPETTPNPEPVSYTHKWVVAEGAIVNWSVYALTQIDYYHNKFYDMQTNSIEHRYNIIYYKTIHTAYEGPNFATTTTWIPSVNSPIDNIFNNNTSEAVGKSKVFGTLKHRANFTIPNPFGAPITPEKEEGAGNACAITPR